MLFSIIVPMYNVEDYIKECMKSILSQTFWDYELILVDDGSTDRTVDIVEKVICQNQTNSTIRLIKKENSGASDTRNQGLKYAVGKYIIFMDSDDIMLPGTLKTMANASITNADLYVFSLKKKRDNEIIESSLTDVSPFKIDKKKSIDALEEYLVRTNYKITWQPWSKLFKREVIVKNNIKFDSRLYSCNDFNFFFAYFLFVHTVEFQNFPAVLYTVDRVGSISTTKMMRRIRSNTFAYVKFFNDVWNVDNTKNQLLDYASYLFLCALDLCENFSKTEIGNIKEIINKNRDVYEYSNRRTSILKRKLISICGLKKGVFLYARIRSVFCSVFKLRRKSEL